MSEATGRARGARRAVPLAVALLLVAGGAVAAWLAGRSPAPPPTPPVATAPAPATTAPAPQRPASPDPLRIGLTEQNAALLRPAGAPADDLAPWRERVNALRPRLLRLLVDWSQLQPDPAAPPAWDRPADGCMRGRPPCAAFGGIREWLRAAAARDAEVLVSVYGTPAWAAAPPAGCERPGTAARSRPPRADALGAYRALLRSLLDVAAAEGARIRWVSPWNEPNGPWFLSPQRAACDAASPSLAPAAYSAIFRAARRAVGDRAGLVLAELAGYERGTPHATGVAEFVRALPRDVACGAELAAQHQYVRAGRRFDAVAALREALAERACTAGLPVWVTETGPGGAPGVEGAAAARSPAACRAYHAALRRWLADPRVGAAFHYTFREDPLFPTGLATARLTRTTPAYDVLRAWAARPRPDEPPGRAC